MKTLFVLLALAAAGCGGDDERGREPPDASRSLPAPNPDTSPEPEPAPAPEGAPTPVPDDRTLDEVAIPLPGADLCPRVDRAAIVDGELFVSGESCAWIVVDTERSER